LSREERLQLELDDKKYVFLGILIILLTVVFVVGWGFFTKIDTYVIAPGKVVIKTFKKPIQYKEWGTVSRIFVKEGDYVSAGQPLIELEKLEHSTNYKVLLVDYYTLLARRDRLLSEKKGLEEINFSSEFLSLVDEKLKEKIVNSQEELFKKRRQKLLQELAILKNRKEQAESRLKGLKDVLKVKRELLEDYIKEIQEQQDLVNRALVSKYRLLDLEREKKKLESEIEDIRAQIIQLESQIREYDKQKALKIEMYQSEIAQELEQVQSKLSEIRPKIKYAEEKVKRTLITAPVSGQVIGLKVYSKGEVVRPGDTLMYIVPKEEEIFILAKVFPQDRDKVHVGQQVDLRFPSFLSIAANVVEGKVTYVSDDTLLDEGYRRQEYYEAHIVLTEKGKEQLEKNNFSLIPGMPAVAYIRAEKVTPIEYILQPVIILVKSAFRAN